ncbi:MAG: helix-turn-helix domain-containing protein [Desulfovibrionaceae bacterium]
MSKRIKSTGANPKAEGEPVAGEKSAAAPVNDLPRLYTPEEVRDAIRARHVKTVYRMVARGELPCRKVGGRLRFTREEYEAMVAGAVSR